MKTLQGKISSTCGSINSLKKYGTVKRTAHSLVIIYKMVEQKADVQKYLDFIDCVEEKDLENSKQEQKVRKTIVSVPKDTEMVKDLTR